MKVSLSSSSLSSVEFKNSSVSSAFKVSVVRKKKVVLRISRQSLFKILGRSSSLIMLKTKVKTRAPS